MDKKDLEQIRATLAEFLGIDPEDVENDDDLVEDLHMQITDLSDFIEKLKNKGYDTSKLDNAVSYTFFQLCEEILD